jgi:hypothetical protein
MAELLVYTRVRRFVCLFILAPSVHCAYNMTPRGEGLCNIQRVCWPTVKRQMRRENANHGQNMR